MSSSGCAQTRSRVPNRSIPHLTSAASGGRFQGSLPQIAERCTRRIAAASVGLEPAIEGREHLSDPLLEARRDLSLRALGLDHRLEMHPELELVGAGMASGQVALHLHPDDVIDLSIQEPLQIPERLLTFGPAIIHRQVLVPWPYPTTHAPALSFPGGACSSRFRSGCP